MGYTYQDLKRLKTEYERVERDVISRCILKQLKKRKIKIYELSDILGISTDTAYAYTKLKGYTVKPDLFNIIMIAEYLNINPLELIKGEEK